MRWSVDRMLDHTGQLTITGPNYLIPSECSKMNPDMSVNSTKANDLVENYIAL